MLHEIVMVIAAVMIRVEQSCTGSSSSTGNGSTSNTNNKNIGSSSTSNTNKNNTHGDCRSSLSHSSNNIRSNTNRHTNNSNRGSSNELIIEVVVLLNMMITTLIEVVEVELNADKYIC